MGVRRLLDPWDDELRAAELAALPITSEHALVAGRLEWDHRDSFDRLLAAQALVEGLELVTVDPAFRAVPERRTRGW
ncbi:type II toxin-antitoxin system VapC family toxin [Agrococcus lahaulensis]|uniref:type II toxin-antitoxin system VapC family toxin n=1 Tax=Agrococcus lahaulensis TaxID=341722 RepID=UPI0004799C54|nr:PIN domain-containing protein [Agrococcus lahaulensis]